MLQAEDIATAALFAAGLPPRATVSDMTIVPTDNQAWRSYAHAIAKSTQQ
jgi:NADP-dependent 3-hydroxy acid dehydrogenase YdfG